MQKKKSKSPSHTSSDTKETGVLQRKQDIHNQGQPKNLNTLMPDNLLFLQGAIGNQAVNQLMAKERVEQTSRDTPDIVQLKKDEAERGEKQKRVAMAKKAIALLKDNLKDTVKNHIFNAAPFNGGAVDKDHPVGLHAYTNGNLPAGISEVSIKGSKRNVHGLEWKYDGKTATKRSSMFPSWMPPDHVCTLIALKYSENTSIVKQAINLLQEGIIKTKVIKYIGKGQDFAIGKTSATIYPIHGDLGDWLDG